MKKWSSCQHIVARLWCFLVRTALDGAILKIVWSLVIRTDTPILFPTQLVRLAGTKKTAKTTFSSLRYEFKIQLSEIHKIHKSKILQQFSKIHHFYKIQLPRNYVPQNSQFSKIHKGHNFSKFTKFTNSQNSQNSRTKTKIHFKSSHFPKLPKFFPNSFKKISKKSQNSKTITYQSKKFKKASLTNIKFNYHKPMNRHKKS